VRSFLTPAEEAVYGRFTGPPEQAVLERFFFLDDADRDLVVVKRGDHNRLGFSLQLVTVRHLGRFLDDPLDVPGVVVDYVASQIEVADPSCVKAYLERKPTRFEHQAEICEVYGYRPYAAVRDSLLAWVGDQAWATGDGPKALFYSAVARLRAERVLLPGVTTLRDEVAGARKAAELRLYVALAEAITAEQADELREILKVPEGKHRSQLELWRRGPKNPTGRGMVRSLERVAEIAGLHMGAVDVAGTGVPTRRVIELARAGFEAKAPKLAALKHHRKIATLLATVRWLEVTATDDALELFDVFMTGELIGRAGRSSDKETLKRAPGQARHAGVLSAAVQVLFEAETWGEAVPLAVVWDAIESAVGSRAKLRTAMEAVQELIPPKDAEPDGQWRAQVVERFNTVRGFIRLLCQVISFGATAEAVRVVNAMRDLPALIDAGDTVRVPKGWLDARKVDIGLVPRGWWNQLVFPKDRPEGCVDRNAYVFCVLELFHTGLKRRDIFARVSDRFADPRARLLADDAWDAVKGRVLSALLILRVVCSIHTRTVSAHDVIRMLQRDGRPTQLGEAFGMYGRIFKTRHVLTLVDDPAYRREMKGMRDLNEGRHDLGRHLFHGRKGELYRAYRDGQEDQLGALGLVLNCVTLWNTVYLDRALTELRTQGYPVLDEDVARLSAYTRRHINVHGHYSFRLPDLGGAWRALRDPDQSDPEEQD